MNQELIKFRGQRKGTNKWVFGDLCTHYENEPDSIYIIDEDCTFHQVELNTVGQFIGKLKTGDEVYINDLIQHGETLKSLVIFSITPNFSPKPQTEP